MAICCGFRRTWARAPAEQTRRTAIQSGSNRDVRSLSRLALLIMRWLSRVVAGMDEAGAVDAVGDRRGG
jgi:hypothetical protein